MLCVILIGSIISECIQGIGLLNFGQITERIFLDIIIFIAVAASLSEAFYK